jgi:predicted transcriptional regulator
MKRVSISASAGHSVSNGEPLLAGAREELALLRFGPLEGRVLHTLWSFDEITLADLHHLLADTAISQSVLRSTLEKLHLKRLIRSRKVHRTCFYRATFDQSTFIRLLRVQLAGFLGEAGMAILKNASETGS